MLAKLPRFLVMEIPSDLEAAELLGHRDHQPQKRPTVGKEIEMRVEGVAIFPFARHDDDQPPPGDPPQFGHGLARLEQVFKQVRAHHGVELAVGKGQFLDLRGVELGAGHGLDPVHDEVRPGDSRQVGSDGSDLTHEEAGPAADVADTVADDRLHDFVHASLRQVRALVHAGMVAVKSAVFLRGQKSRILAELGKPRHVGAPSHARNGMEYL